MNGLAPVKPKLLLLDGPNLAYRCIHRPGVPLSFNGKPTTGVYAFTRAYFELIARMRPAYFAVAWDTPRAQYERRRIFPGYKAGRSVLATDGDISSQLEWIKKIIHASGVPFLQATGWEADDVIATCVRRFQDEVFCVVAAKDKDLHQVVSNKCHLYDGELWITPREVFDRWGVEPKDVVHIQTLAGDPTDGVPGVAGIGLKRAAELIGKHIDVDGVIEAARTLSPKMRKALSDFDPVLGRKLVELNSHVEVVHFGPSESWAIDNLDQLAFTKLNSDGLKPLFSELGFKPWN